MPKRKTLGRQPKEITPEKEKETPIAKKEEAAPVFDLGDLIEVPDQILTSKARRIREVLAAQEKVRFMIPQVLLDKDPFITGGINGYLWKVRKNAMVNIPIQVAKLLAESYKMTNAAGEEWRVEREKSEKGVTLQKALQV